MVVWTSVEGQGSGIVSSAVFLCTTCIAVIKFAKDAWLEREDLRLENVSLTNLEQQVRGQPGAQSLGIVQPTTATLSAGRLPVTTTPPARAHRALEIETTASTSRIPLVGRNPQ